MLFTYMVPVFFLQTAQKRSNIFKRPVPVSPTNMLFEPKHLRKCSGRVPCRKHERQDQSCPTRVRFGNISHSSIQRIGCGQTRPSSRQ